MGNMQGGHRKESKHGQVVTVLQGDGRVMEFSRPLRVADLLHDHPEHFVCHSSALVLLQQGKMLPPSTLLMAGNVYFLLPLPKTQMGDVAAQSSGKPGEAKCPGGTMKFLITKQQLAKILAEGTGTVKVAVQEPAPVLPRLQGQSSHVPSRLSVLHRPSPTLIKRTVSWSPGLESISEVPVM